MRYFLFTICFAAARFAAALEAPCWIDTGDGEIPKVIEHRIEFRGPSNQFWNYMSGDASTWAFEIVSSPQSKRTRPKIAKVSIRLPDGTFVHFEKDLKFQTATRLTFQNGKIAEFVQQMTSSLRKILDSNRIAFPALSKQTLEMMFEFESDGSYSENWLNHTCRIGFGNNQLKGKLSGLSPAETASDLKVKVNNPPLDTDVKDQFFLKTDSEGSFEIKGLPLGTFIVDLPTPNKAAPIVYMDDLPMTCNMSLLKGKSAEKGWTVTQNSCSSLKRGR